MRSSARPTTSRAASCSRARTRERVWRGRGRRADRRRRVRGLRRGGYEGMLPVRRMRGDWWELNEEGTIAARRRAAAATLRLGDPIARRASRGRSTRRAERGGSRGLRAVRSSSTLVSGDGQGASARSAPAMLRPTATRRFRYNLLERFECGDRARPAPRSSRCAAASAQLKDGFATIRDGELWLRDVHIPPYAPASRENHEPERERKLLLHRREIERLARARRRARADARADADLLLGLAREGRDRARARQGRARQARDAAPPRLAARDRARAARGAPRARRARPGSCGARRSSACRARARRSGRCRRRRPAARLRGETR